MLAQVGAVRGFLVDGISSRIVNHHGASLASLHLRNALSVLARTWYEVGCAWQGAPSRRPPSPDQRNRYGSSAARSDGRLDAGNPASDATLLPSGAPFPPTWRAMALGPVAMADIPDQLPQSPATRAGGVSARATCSHQQGESKAG